MVSLHWELIQLKTNHDRIKEEEKVAMRAPGLRSVKAAGDWKLSGGSWEDNFSGKNSHMKLIQLENVATVYLEDAKGLLSKI